VVWSPAGATGPSSAARRERLVGLGAGATGATGRSDALNVDHELIAPKSRVGAVATTTRLQLTLFGSGPQAAALEIHRRALDPVQASLIALHVTLCREDELALSAPEIADRLERAPWHELELQFGPPERFQVHGVLLPCTGGEDRFHQLRQWVLKSSTVRRHRPHLTLAHPRNPRSPGNTDVAISRLPRSTTLSFDTVWRIRQEGHAPWRTLGSTKLGVARAARGGQAPSPDSTKQER
jgi:hypothetical protein